MDNWSLLLDVMIFVVPVVVIGGQMGPRVIRDVNDKYLRIYIAMVLILVSGLIFSQV